MVLLFGLMLLLAAVAGGFILSWKSGLVSVGDEPEVAVVDIAQVCAAVGQHNREFPQQLTTTLQQGVEAVLAGDQAAGDKAEADAAALAKQWTGKLRDEAARTDNTDLRAAVNDLANTLKPVETGEASLNDMQKLVEEGNASIAPYCPNASPSP